ncbi:MAG: histidine kinase dimerization/phospho-acceptor domain-containing protein [Sutterellaceae bacterium]|nr:histidine kinase dimerization/phospho-acceptor domain-containing protein [Sutterellaceae bacterium]
MFNLGKKRREAPSQNPSLVRRALVWCSATLAGFCVVTAIGSFAIGYERATEVQDDVLKEVVGILSRDVVQQKYKDRIKELTTGGFYGPGSKFGTSIEASDQAALTMDDDTFEDSYELDDDHHSAMVNAGETVLVRLLHKRGRAVGVTFNQSYTDGAHTVNIFNEPHRIYLRTLKDGTHVAAGQRLKERNNAILASALTSAAPILILAPVMLLVLLFALWRALKPLQKFEDEVNARKGDDLTPLETAGIPREVQAMVQAVNRLLSRVSDLRRREARFVADAAHELRTPMTVLNLQVERLSDMDLTPEVRDKVEELKRALERATNMISQMLALKRAQAQEEAVVGQHKANCLQTVTGVLEDLYWVAQQKNIALDVEGFDSAGFETVDVQLRSDDVATLV